MGEGRVKKPEKLMTSFLDGPLVIAILTSCGGSLIGAFCGSSYVAYTVTRFVTAVGKFTKLYPSYRLFIFRVVSLFPREKTQVSTYVDYWPNHTELEIGIGPPL